MLLGFTIVHYVDTSCLRSQLHVRYVPPALLGSNPKNIVARHPHAYTVSRSSPELYDINSPNEKTTIFQNVI